MTTIETKINALSLKQVLIIASVIALIIVAYQNRETLKAKLNP
jgi:hypothetical protein